MLVRLMESQIWCLPARSVALLLHWRRAQTKDNGLFLPFCLLESCSQAPSLMPDTSFSPYMPLVPFKLLLWFWSSERMSLNKFVCGFFKGNYLGLQKFLTLTQSLLVFAVRSYGVLFLTLEPWAGRHGMGLGLFTLNLFLLNSYPPCMHVRPDLSMSLPLLPVWIDMVSLIP